MSGDLRQEASRALAKALAFKACGKDAEARDWAIRLVRILECSSILAHDLVEPDPVDGVSRPVAAWRRP